MSISERIPAAAKRPRFWWVTFAVWFVLLFVLSSISGSDSSAPRLFMWWDKVAHTVYFTSGSAALCWALTLRGGWRFGSNKLLVFGCCVVMAAVVGVFDEWHQSFTPGREGNDLGDWIADLVGGVLGCLLGFLLLPSLSGPAPSRDSDSF